MYGGGVREEGRCTEREREVGEARVVVRVGEVRVVVRVGEARVVVGVGEVREIWLIRRREGDGSRWRNGHGGRGEKWVRMQVV